MPQLDLGKVVGDTGPQGPKGDQGIQGPAGPTGPGVVVGGSANQVLVKHSGTNYDTQWVDAGNLPSIAGVQDAIAIVANGDTHPAIASGQFVYVRNHSTLAEGLYKATAAIGTDVALTTSNLTADGSGGLNDLKGQIDSLNSNLQSNEAASTSSYRNVWFSDNSNDLKRVHDADFQYNPGTNDLKVGTINGKTVKDIFTKDYQIEFDGWEAGTPGVRAAQKSLSIASDINTYGAVIGMFITYISNSSSAHYQAFLYNESVYVNAYRANSSSLSAGYPVTVRVVFAK